MSADERSTESKTKAAVSTDAAGRKPYQKPSFVREQVFETMALACGKVSTTSGACRIVKKNS